MPYTKHNWQTQEPITQAKMQNIEDGIENAHSGLDSRYTKTEINTMVSNINSNVSTAQTTANNALTIAQNVQLNTSGDQALGQIQDATINHEPKFNTLDLRLASIDANVGDAVSYATTSRDELNNAHLGFNSLRDKLNDMDDKTREQTQRITNIKEEVENARRGKSMLVDKITEIDTNISDDKTDIANIKAIIGYPVAANPEKTIQDIIGETNQALTDGIIEAKNYADTQLSNAKASEIIGAHRSLEDTLTDRFEDIEDDIEDIKDDITDITTNISTISTGITNTNNANSERFGTIEDAISALQAKSSTIVISEEAFATLQENIESGEEDPNPFIDYIVGPNTDGKYYYWKWINDSDEDKWKLISGGGGSGTGTSSALVFESLAAFEAATINNKDENTDYYVKDVNNYYTHYRFEKNDDVYTRIEIKQDAYTTAQTYSKTEVYNKAETDATIATAIENIDKDEYSLTYGTTLYGQDQVETENVLTLYRRESGATEGTPVSQVIIAGGGGGGTGPVGTIITLNRITQSPIVITPTDNAIISVEYSCVDDQVEITGYYTWSKGTQTLMSGTLTQGLNTFDLTPYCTVGSQRLKLTVTNENGTQAPPKYWDVQMIDVRIESTFNDKYAYNGTDYVNFTYTPYGAVNKTVHIKLDGREVASVPTISSGTLMSYSIAPQTHGAHLLEAYITAVVNNKNIETSHIYKDIIWAHSGNRTPIIGCIYRYDYYGEIFTKQYNSFTIPYYVYDPRSTTPTVILSENGNTVNTIKVSSASNVWAYKSNTVTWTEEDEGTPNILTISCGTTNVEIKANITELGYTIEPITTNLAFDFNPSGYSNGDILHRLWNYTANNKTTSLTVSNNFDWSNGGYQLDSEGNTYFCVKSGTRAYIDYKLFETDPRNSGAEFKIIFKTTNVENVNASFLRCLTDNETDKVGLEMRTHEAYFSTETNTLEIPYSEEDVIEFEYNINPVDMENASATSYIMTYEDGVGARPLIYEQSTRLNQFSPAANIEIGSDNCDVWIYRMKAYTSALTDVDILKNFYADARNSDEMIARYERNQIYDENGRLTPESVAAACPDLKVIKIEAPYFTNDKKDYVKGTKVECIHTNGRPRDNWTWENGYHVGQGTSSNRYGAAGRNIDIIFGFDGEHTVVSKIKENDVQGYISKVTFSDGTILSGADAKINLSETSVENSWFNIKVNIASSENANNALLQKRYNQYLPYLTPAKKRDSRVKNSMEFYNCVIFIKETDETQNAEGIYTAHREFPRDTDWHFYGIGNIGDSKKTDNTRVNNPNDIKEFCVEVSDNNLPNSMFQTGVYRLDNGSYTFTPPINDSEQMERMVYPITEAQWEDERNLARKALSLEGYVSGQKLNEDTGEMEDVITNWDSSFEFRYDMGTKDGESFPGLEEQQELSKLKWNEMYKWVITCPDNKFAEELGNWFIVDSPLYWYLFTERYIMIDNRAKNSFYHYGKIYITEEEAAEMGDDARNYTIDNAAAAINEGYRFELWNYDDDTALGIDNSGLLKIPYGKEDIDKDELGAYIYNAAENIFWRRIRTLMNRQLTTLYSNTNLTSCWSANNLINEFDRWQNQFPEELWRLDIERKYIRPYQTGSWVQKDRVYSRDRTFLEGMANGRKKYQRRQFERDQEVYVATKYLQSAIFADSVEMRLATADPESAAVVPINDTIKITPYSDMYIRVMFGNTDVVSRRAKAGIEYEISPPFAITSRNTLQITVYAASRIQAFSDLSAFYIRDNNFSRATKLKTLVLGNSTPGYKNTALTSVGIGDNVLLETLDLRNLPNLTGTLNLTNCKNLKNLYASNTNLTAINFANGGKITNAILPGTLNSLIFRNLSLLTNLNIAGYNNLTTFICENSNVINPLNIIQTAINTLQAITVTDLVWTLNNITLLNNIYSKSTSLLSGLATITGGIKREEIIKYNEKWPDLELNLNNADITEQWEITFTYTDITGNSHTYKEYVEDGEVAPDPMYLGLLDPVPGKPSETEVDYVFGNWIRNSNTGEMEYQEFSGWKKRDGIQMSPTGATSNMEYIPVFNTTPRKYSIEWYADNIKIDETTVGYGTQAVTEQTPNNKWDPNTQTAQIFAGWDKSTGQVKENMVGENRVNAVWLTGTIPTKEELEQNGLNGLNEAQIYALSKTDANTRLNLLSDYIRDYKEIRLGNDYDYTNVESVVLVEDDETLGYDSTNLNMATDERTIKVFDGQSRYNQTLPNIRPLSYENGFTIALDFKVHQISGENQNYVLTCFQNVEDTEKGFKIVLTSTGNVNITWGSSTNSRQIGIAGRRNIVVIRKARNDNNLYVYHDSASMNSNGILQPNITQIILNGSDNSTEMPLIFGSTGILNINDNSVTLPSEKRIAKSIIYWSKIWKEDLGEAVCKEIASLCHEKIQFQLEGFNDLVEGHDSIYKIYSNDEITDKTVNLSFVAGSLLTTYKYNLTTQSGADPGWSESVLRTICNNRLFKSFPVTWRSIIADTPTRTYGRQLEDSTSNRYGPTSRITVYDKIYIPSVKELNFNYNTGTSTSEGVLRPIPWHTQLQAYTTDGGKTTLSSINYSLIRFVQNRITPEANIFYYPSTSNPYYNSVNINNVQLKTGDLWIPSNRTSELLMYISQEDYIKYGYDEVKTDGSSAFRTDGDYDCGGNGGWLWGNIAGYHTRTINTSTTYSYWSFYYVSSSGAITYSTSGIRRLLLGFSV